MKDSDTQSLFSRRQFNKLFAGSMLAVGSGLIKPALAEQPGLMEAARKEGRVNVYGDSSMVAKLADGFTKTYPDIQVATVPGGGWQTYNRMLVEKNAGRMIADILIANDDTCLYGYEAGVFGNIETTAGYPAETVSGQGYIITYYMLTPIIYNVDACKGLKLPKDWDDFTQLGDEWKDRIICADPRNSGTALYVLMALYQVLGKERATAILSAWKRLGTEIAPNTGVQVAKLVSGEKPLSVSMHTGFFQDMKQKGAPVDLILPASGAVMQVDAMAVPKDAPHPYAARLFIDWTMGPEGSRILAANGDYPAGSETIAPEGLPPRKSIKVMGKGPKEALRDRDAVIEWFKVTMGIS
jgi:iron(III) transport system substrate-binding protein